MSTHVNGETSTDCSGLQIELQTFPAGEKKNSLFGGWFCSFMSTVYHSGFIICQFLLYEWNIVHVVCNLPKQIKDLCVLCVYCFPFVLCLSVWNQL